MRRKKGVLAAFLVMVASFAFGDTLTPRIGLTQPTTSFGDIWGVKINNNSSLIDGAVAGQSLYNVFTTTNTFAGAVYFPNISPGLNFTVDATGLLIGQASGSGGGASTLATFVNGVQISSPTARQNFSANFVGSLAGAGTAQIDLNPSTTYYIHNGSAAQTAALNVSTATIGNITVSTLTVLSSATITNVNLSGNTLAYSSGTFLNSVSIGGTNPNGQSLRVIDNGSGINTYESPNNLTMYYELENNTSGTPSNIYDELVGTGGDAATGALAGDGEIKALKNLYLVAGGAASTNGIKISTNGYVSVSSITANEIPYAGGAASNISNGLVGSSSLIYFSSADVGSLGHENLIQRGFEPFYVQASSNAMGIGFFDNLQIYTNSHIWAAIVEHPNAFPSIADGNMNIYQRDGGHIFLDVTGQSGHNTGTMQVRMADQNGEPSPWVAEQIDSTSTTVFSDMKINCSLSNVNQFCPHQLSAVLEASSTTRGFLPPRMTTTQKNAISSPAAGLMVYDTTLSTMSFYNGVSWLAFGGGSGGSGSPGGSSGQLQFNSGSTFAGSANSFVTVSSVTISTLSALGHVGINASSPAETLKVVQTQNPGNAVLLLQPMATANGVAIQVNNANGNRAMYIDAYTGELHSDFWVDASSITLNGSFLQLSSKTHSQITALTPAAVGQEYYCSDCSTVATCISTGTAVGAFGLITSKTSPCQ